MRLRAIIFDLSNTPNAINEELSSWIDTSKLKTVFITPKQTLPSTASSAQISTDTKDSKQATVTLVEPKYQASLVDLGLLPDEVVCVGDHAAAQQAASAMEMSFIGIGTAAKEGFITSDTNILGVVDALPKIRTLLEPTQKAVATASYIATIQKRIHVAIQRVGGYWQPLAALARLSEELGELCAPQYTKKSLGEELADVYIISTCIANQYCARLNYETSEKLSLIQLRELVYQVGKIARTVNYYEGPKKPKENEEIETIEKSVSKLHSLLIAYANRSGIDLMEEVGKKVSAMEIRDAKRFDISYDPSAGQALGEFEAIRKQTKCPFAKRSKVWGNAKPWDTKLTIEQNLELVISDFKRFIKISSRERLDMFVVAAPAEYGKTVEHLAEFTRRALTFLGERDPTSKNCMKYNSGDIAVPGWHFNFAEQDFFISTFSPCYPASSSRTTYENKSSIFLVFQPKHSFKQHLPPSPTSKEAYRQRIRLQFAKDGKKYDREDIFGEKKVEAFKYVKPFSASTSIASWWHKKPINFPADPAPSPYRLPVKSDPSYMPPMNLDQNNKPRCPTIECAIL